jgi:hypothetical protein
VVAAMCVSSSPRWNIISRVSRGDRAVARRVTPGERRDGLAVDRCRLSTRSSSLKIPVGALTCAPRTGAKTLPATKPPRREGIPIEPSYTHGVTRELESRKTGKAGFGILNNIFSTG